MNRRTLLLQLLPGLVPLFAFLIVDEIWGTKPGLIVAIASGIIELSYYWIRDHRFDKFILFDTLLIIVLGVVSIILENDIFFKIKPALLGLLMCGVLGVSAFTPGNLLLNMSKRYMKGIDLNDQQQMLMKKNLRTLFWMFAGYTLLVLYSTWFMSTAAWGFISGALLYILFGAWFLTEIIKTRLTRNRLQNEEWLPLVNEKGEVTGKAPRSVCHSDKQYLHPVVHLHVFNSRGELFLQKRPMNKIQPGKWDTAVGGHIAADETVETALHRETSEEIRLKDFKAALVARYVWESDIEHEYVFCFITVCDQPLSINRDELDDGRFWPLSEISENLGKGIFTPNIENEFRTILKDIYKKIPRMQ